MKNILIFSDLELMLDIFNNKYINIRQLTAPCHCTKKESLNSKYALWKLIGQLSLTFWLISLFNQEINKPAIYKSIQYTEGGLSSAHKKYSIL